MSEIVERAKVAIAEKFVHAIDMRAPYAQVMLDAAARAVLAAMREPTEAMVQAGYDECEQGTDREMVAEAWRAMIDEARK